MHDPQPDQGPSTEPKASGLPHDGINPDDRLDWGTLLHALSMADSSPNTFRGIEAALLDIAEALAALPPLECKLRERQILGIMRTKRIRGAGGILEAARKQFRQSQQGARTGKTGQNRHHKAAGPGDSSSEEASTMSSVGV